MFLHLLLNYWSQDFSLVILFFKKNFVFSKVGWFVRKKLLQILISYQAVIKFSSGEELILFSMEEQGHKNPPPSLPPLQIYFLKFLIFSCLFDWTKFSFVCFLKILLKIMFHLLSFRYFVKCIQNGFLYSTICLLQGFCDMFMSIFVFVFLLVVCSYIYIIYIYTYIYI